MAGAPPRSPLAPAALPPPPAVAGVRIAAMAAGLRYRGRHDLTLLAFPAGATVGGVLTRSATAGHPVLWCRRLLPEGRIRALLVNAGNANVFRGAEGDRAVRLEAEAAAKALGCTADEVFIASTGVIGERLPVEAITSVVPSLSHRLGGDGLAEAAAAIMTTDTFAKWSSAEAVIDGVPVTVAGIAKGSGMIAPNMATMLAFVMTDAALPATVLQSLVEAAAEGSFNAITVDGDSSTSDTCLLIATHAAGHAPIERADDPRLEGFRNALEGVMRELALLVVRDGEGAQKLITIRLEGAASNRSAKAIALAIANSPLVKTAIAGGDANWGRIIMAIGKAGEPIETDALGIAFGGTEVARDGGAVPELDETPVTRHLAGREIEIDVRVGRGPGRAVVWTCDLTHGYIDINADYRS